MTLLLVFLTACGLLFFSLVETAFGLLMRLPERLEAERENERGVLGTYLHDPLRFFVPVRLMRGMMLVLLMVFLAQPIGTGGFTRALVLFAVGFGVALVVGQVLPAIMVRRRPERYLDLLLPPFTVVANAVWPLTARIAGWLEPAGAGGRGNGGTLGGVGQVPDAGPEEPQRVEEDRLLRSVVDFGDTLVREVMTPRPDIVAIEAQATIDDLRDLVAEEEYSRLPVYAENLDNIAGIVVVKDLIQLGDTPADAPVTTLMREAAFVPETKRVADLLREFQQGRFQLAIVVDEYGGTAGLVTIEDVVEELVGEIHDEYDSDVEPIVEESPDCFVMSAKLGTDEMVERLGLAIEVDEGGFETVGGYVLARVGRVPEVGEQFTFDGLEVEILEAERRRIHKVRFRRLPAETGGEPG